MRGENWTIDDSRRMKTNRPAKVAARGLAGPIAAGGDGSLALLICNDTASVGFAFHTGALTIDSTPPSSPGARSEDLRGVVQVRGERPLPQLLPRAGSSAMTL